MPRLPESFGMRLARVGLYFAFFLCALLAIPTGGMGLGHRDFGPAVWGLLLLPLFFIFAYLILRSGKRK